MVSGEREPSNGMWNGRLVGRLPAWLAGWLAGWMACRLRLGPWWKPSVESIAERNLLATQTPRLERRPTRHSRNARQRVRGARRRRERVEGCWLDITTTGLRVLSERDSEKGQDRRKHFVLGGVNARKYNTCAPWAHYFALSEMARNLVDAESGVLVLQLGVSFEKDAPVRKRPDGIKSSRAQSGLQGTKCPTSGANYFTAASGCRRGSFWECAFARARVMKLVATKGNWKLASLGNRALSLKRRKKYYNRCYGGDSRRGQLMLRNGRTKRPGIAPPPNDLHRRA
ncbi:hypothetical protein DBV15_01650 [Temnothorax longispinosus]|uniref:Uncharacterized protein n=1 Tax=Temnothorax longispinosus TaxID=300112 RepID=A0A4S2L702_9HYME|nr:hypothetical protein DBV15_01650 [Temnothorax longispinosus]